MQVLAPARTIPELLLDQARSQPDELAVAAPAGRALTWSDLESRVRAVATSLRRAGVDEQDVIVLSLPNGLDTVLVLLAAMSAAVAAPRNPALTVVEARGELVRAGAGHVVVDGGDTPAGEAATALGIPQLDLHALLAAAETDLERPPASDAVSLLLPTTGTTGTPKLVQLSHANLLAAASITAQTLELTPDDRCLNVMPLFHTHGLVGGLLASLHAGASIVCTRTVDDRSLLAGARTYGPTWTTAAPALQHVILNTARANPGAFRFRFVRSTSAPLPPALFAELARTFAAPVVEAYALTEAPGQITSNPLPPLARKPGTVGFARGCEVRLLDDDGARGDVGEILVRGPHVTRGYLGATSDEFVDDWLRTGDLGRFDDDGYLTIVGRVKEMINRGGEKVSPRDVDDVLQLHPAVRDAAAFAIPHRTLGEDVCAAVVLEDGAVLDAADLIRFARERLAAYKVPTRIVFVDRLPRTAVGKIPRHALAAELFPGQGQPA